MYFTAYLWSLAEGLTFFIVPDVLLGAFVLFSPRKALRAIFFSVAGSLSSAVVIFGLAKFVPQEWLFSVLDTVPGISMELIARVGGELSVSGLPALVMAPLSGIPYKIYTAQAATLGFDLGAYLGWSVLSRLERIVTVFFVVWMVRRRFAQTWHRHPKAWLVAYGIAWLLIYLVYYRVALAG